MERVNYRIDPTQFQADLETITKLSAEYRRLTIISDSIHSSLIHAVLITNDDALDRLGLIESEYAAMVDRTILQHMLEVLLVEMAQVLQKKNDQVAAFSRKYSVPTDPLLRYLDMESSQSNYA